MTGKLERDVRTESRCMQWTSPRGIGSPEEPFRSRRVLGRRWGFQRAVSSQRGFNFKRGTGFSTVLASQRAPGRQPGTGFSTGYRLPNVRWLLNGYRLLNDTSSSTGTSSSTWGGFSTWYQLLNGHRLLNGQRLLNGHPLSQRPPLLNGVPASHRGVAS